MTQPVEPQAGRGNSSDHVRRHNLSLILERVHYSRGMSRSQLTKYMGLNRSTIAALVGELVERRLVVETEPSTPGLVGRPSPVVTPDTRAVAIAVNPETDAITVGIVALGGTVLHRIRHVTETVPDAEEAVRIIAAIIERLKAELAPHSVVGIGVAVPGLVQTGQGLVRLAPHLGWVEQPLARMLKDATGYPTVVANDASLGCVAESLFGAGRGVPDMIYLNGSASGIGGGIIAGGVPLGGVAGYAGEFGHVLANSDGRQCDCGATGCLETEVVRARLLELAGLGEADADELEQWLLANPTAEVIAEVHRQLDYLAISMRNAINVLNPQLIVIGGFLGTLNAVAPGYLDALIARLPLRAPRESVRLVRAELGQNLLMIGAAESAFGPVLADPGSFSG